MSTSSFYLDVSNPQYRDNGCPSQCMSNNEYTTVGDYYSFGTDPKTALINNLTTPEAQNVTGTSYGEKAPLNLRISRFGMESVDPSYKQVLATGLPMWNPYNRVEIPKDRFPA